ncbi:MAG: patatin-like phospholipase family protein [Neisseriaceae bacterium]
MRFYKRIQAVLQLTIPLGILFFLILLFIYHSDRIQQKALNKKQIEQQLSSVHQKIVKPYKGVKIGLALGAGGAKGFAHIGVIKVLQENGIPVRIVVGTSAGSVVGVLYAYGFDAKAIQRILTDVGFALMDFDLSFTGFIQGKKLKELVNRSINHLPLEALSKKFGVVATDFSSGDTILLTQGDAGQAVRASSSIPAIFKPAEIAGRLYVDGGLSAPVPVSQARRLGADVVIAVDISSHPAEQGALYQPSSWFSTIDHSISILINKQVEGELKKADVVIQPKLSSTEFLNFFSMASTIEAGERAARRALPKIKAAIEKAKQEKMLLQATSSSARNVDRNNFEQGGSGTSKEWIF